MPRKRLRQKKHVVVTSVVKRWKRKDVFPAYVQEFAPFSYTVNGVSRTMSQEDFDALGARLPDLCMVCRQEERALVNAYCPSDPQRWGAPPGKDRLIWYTLCASCMDLPDCSALVEKMLAEYLGISGYA